MKKTSSILLAILIVAILLLPGCKQSRNSDNYKAPIASNQPINSYALYYKNGEVYFADFEQGNQIKLEAFAANENVEVSSRFYTYGDYWLASNIFLSDDRSKIFYPAELQDTYLGFYSLCYQDLTNASAQPQILADNVSGYCVSDDGCYLICIENLTDLFYIDVATPKKEFIATIAETCETFLSPDGQKVIYEAPQDKNMELYLWEREKGSTRISNSSNQMIYITGISKDFSCVYFTEQTTNYDSNSYIYDYASGKTKLISEGGWFQYVYDTNEAYYEEDNYLVYYDGDNNTVIETLSHAEYSQNTAVAICKSESDIGFDYVVIKDKKFPIHPVDGNACISPDGSAAYILNEDNQLYKISISKNGIEQDELIDNDASRTIDKGSYGLFFYDNKLVYMKESDEGSISLWIDGEQIADELTRKRFCCVDDTLLYQTNGANDARKLNIYRDDRLITIDEDVHSYILLSDGNLLYRISSKDEQGDAYYYDMQEQRAQLIAEDISLIATIFKSGSRGWQFKNMARYIENQKLTVALNQINYLGDVIYPLIW